MRAERECAEPSGCAAPMDARGLAAKQPSTIDRLRIHLHSRSSELSFLIIEFQPWPIYRLSSAGCRCDGRSGSSRARSRSRRRRRCQVRLVCGVLARMWAILRSGRVPCCARCMLRAARRALYVTCSRCRALHAARAASHCWRRQEGHVDRVAHVYIEGGPDRLRRLHPRTPATSSVQRATCNMARLRRPLHPACHPGGSATHEYPEYHGVRLVRGVP